jgi:hypothetical protein
MSVDTGSHGLFFQEKGGALVFLDKLCTSLLLSSSGVKNHYDSNITNKNNGYNSNNKNNCNELDAGAINDIEMSKLANKSKSKFDYCQISKEVTGYVVEAKRMIVTPNNSKSFLCHLPLNAEVVLVELDMRPLLNPTIYELHREEFEIRARARADRLRAARRRDSAADKRRLKFEAAAGLRLADSYVNLDVEPSPNVITNISDFPSLQISRETNSLLTEKSDNNNAQFFKKINSNVSAEDFRSDISFSKVLTPINEASFPNMSNKDSDSNGSILSPTKISKPKSKFDQRQKLKTIYL